MSLFRFSAFGYCIISIVICGLPARGFSEVGTSPTNTRANATPEASSAETEKKVLVHFPNPTDIRKIIDGVAQWSDKVFVVGNNVSGKVAIPAPEPLTVDVAYQRFTSAVQKLGFGLVESDGIVTIERQRSTKDSEKFEFQGPAAKMPDNTPVPFNFVIPTDLNDVIVNASQWNGQRYVLTSSVIGGKVSVFSAGPVPKEKAYLAFRQALRITGYAEVNRGQVYQVLPVRLAKQRADLYSETLKRFESLVGTVLFNYPSPTELREVVKNLSSFTGVNFVLDKTAKGKLQILSAGEVSKQDAYKIFLVALDSLGLAAVEQQGVIKVIPQRLLKRAAPK